MMRFFEEFKELAEERRHQLLTLSLENGLSNPVCGDEAVVCFELEGDRVERLRYHARGCWPVFGCLEYLARRFSGCSLAACSAFRLEHFLAEVDGVPASKRHAFSLTHRAFVRGLVEAVAAEGGIGTGGKERV